MILNTWRWVITFGDEEEADNDEQEIIDESDDDEEIVYMDELVYPEQMDEMWRRNGYGGFFSFFTLGND